MDIPTYVTFTITVKIADTIEERVMEEIALEFEQMLNSTGPTGGKVLCKNGEPPRAIGIVHCVGSRDENYNRYCSRVCCMAASASDAARQTSRRAASVSTAVSAISSCTSWKPAIGRPNACRCFA